MAEAKQIHRATDPFLKRVWGEITDLGLELHIAEIDSQGFTVIPPEVACPNGLGDRLLAACMDVAERRNGVRPPNLASAASYAPQNSDRFKKVLGSENGDSPVGDFMQCLLFEGEVFEEALLNPVLLSVATYLCGYSCVLYSMGCFVKGPNNTTLPLHADTAGPSPLPAAGAACNATYVLTEFNRDNGATAFVPGSHKWCRKPQGEETKVIDNPKAVAVEARAGSLVMWHGNTWHGAFNRKAHGLRVSIPTVFARPHIRTQENLIDKVPQSMLDRNPPRFAILTHQGIPLGWSNHDEAASVAQRAMGYEAAYIKDLGLNPAMSPESLFA